MILTQRDVRVLRDLSLSTLLSRDQILALGYFSSVTRANTRLRLLRASRYVDVLSTPFYGQFLYIPGPLAGTAVGDRVAEILERRNRSPRFIEHSLAVTETRLALARNGYVDWRFEPQLRQSFRFGGLQYEVRPDGLASLQDRRVVLEVDLGHVAPKKFREKLLAYELFARSGESHRRWGTDTVHILTVTTGPKRVVSLSMLLPRDAPIEHRVATFDELGIRLPWRRS